MSKISFIEIANKRYPMSFSLGAAKRITAKYGNLEKIGEIFSEGVDEKALDMICDIATLLIAQGCAYKNYFEKDMPRETGDAVNQNGEFVAISREMLEVGLGLMDLKDVAAKLMEAMGVSMETEIEVTEKEEIKNAEATPES